MGAKQVVTTGALIGLLACSGSPGELAPQSAAIPPASPGVCAGGLRFGPYFPPDDEDQNKQSLPGQWQHSGWWKRYLVQECRDWSEPPLWNCGIQRGPDTVRAFSPWGGLAVDVVSRIERTAKGATLHVQFPILCTARVMELSANDWQGLEDCLDSATFWTEKSHKQQAGLLDAESTILEAAISGRYNAVMHGDGSEPPRPASFACFDRIERWTASIRKAVLTDDVQRMLDTAKSIPPCR